MAAISPSFVGNSPWMTQERFPRERQYTIHSILASAKVAERLPIQDLRARGVFTEVGQLRSPHRISFHAGPRHRYMTLFRNGTATVRGCRSIIEAEALLKEVNKRVAPFCEVHASKMPIFVQNIVASVDLGVPLNLSKVSETLASLDLSYEPEQFPALIFRPRGGKIVVLLFASGKLVVVGSRSEDELATTLRSAVELLAQAFH